MNKDQLFIKKVTEAKNRNLWGLPFFCFFKKNDFPLRGLTYENVKEDYN